MRYKYSNQFRLGMTMLVGAVGVSACASTGQRAPASEGARPVTSGKMVAQFQSATGQSVAGEYVVTASPSITDDAMTSAGQKCSAQNVKSLGNHQYLVKFGVDLGVEKLKSCLKDARISATVQPNFVYKLGPSPGFTNPTTKVR